MPLKSINPFTGEEINSYDIFSKQEMNDAIDDVAKNQKSWELKSVKERFKLIAAVKNHLLENKERFATLMTAEMGKLKSESIAEIEKCALLCDYYMEVSEEMLQPEEIKTDAKYSGIDYDPLGNILGVMPWNFPFWQVFRFAIPTLIAGNGVLLKHASNVAGCAVALEEIFNVTKEGVFATLLISAKQVEEVLANDKVNGVSLTGSEAAGRSVAALAGKYLKPSLLELGGNSAFIVLNDCDIDRAVDDFIVGRYLNSGQSCVSAKRLMIQEDIHDTFLKKLKAKVQEFSTGDPNWKNTKLAPMARKDLAEELEAQVKESIKKGAKLYYGNERSGAMYKYTILNDVAPGMPAFDEELFGPVTAAMKVKDLDEAIALTNNSKFGLGVSIYTSSTDAVRARASEFNEGAVFINSIVKSDPRIPFGGVKNSGYGRELAKNGLMAFVNQKTIYLKD